jgi:hypothetical protein
VNFRELQLTRSCLRATEAQQWRENVEPLGRQHLSNIRSQAVTSDQSICSAHHWQGAQGLKDQQQVAVRRNCGARFLFGLRRAEQWWLLCLNLAMRHSDAPESAK